MPIFFDQSTIEMISREFNAAVRREESWADMQELLLTIDRLAALKEEKGRYFISFASKNELLRCLTDHVVLVNVRLRRITHSDAQHVRMRIPTCTRMPHMAHRNSPNPMSALGQAVQLGDLALPPHTE